jgi:hypothetical protein
VSATEAGKAAPGLRRGLPKVFCATGEQHRAFKAHRQKTQIIVRGCPPATESSVATVSSRFLREEIDTYPAIAVLNGNWRVVVCKHSIQWILQRRGGERWRSRYFCRTREGLIACAREYCGQIDGVALARLLRLPPQIGGA